MTSVNMFWTKRVVIGDGERGLVYRNRQFERVLDAGVYRMFDPLKRVEVIVHNIAQPEYAGCDVDALIASLGNRLGETFVLADIGADEVGLVSKHGNLVDVLAPGSRKLYWRGIVEVQVQCVSLAEGLELRQDAIRRLRQLGLLDKVAVAVTVPVESAGLVFVNGKLVRTLEPGAYAFWNFQKNVAAEVIELRVQSVEVSGQELLTRDKVSLRVNLAASLRVTDPVAARTKVAKYRLRVPRVAVRPAQGGFRQDAGRAARRQGIARRGHLRVRARPRGCARCRGARRRCQGRDPAGRDEEHPQRPGAGFDVGAGQHHPQARGGERDAFPAQHRQADRREPDLDAFEGAGSSGEGHREDRQAHGIRRPGWRAEAIGQPQAVVLCTAAVHGGKEPAVHAFLVIRRAS